MSPRSWATAPISMARTPSEIIPSVLRPTIRGQDLACFRVEDHLGHPSEAPIVVARLENFHRYRFYLNVTVLFSGLILP